MKQLFLCCIMGISCALGSAAQGGPPDPPVEGNAAWYPAESKRLSAAHADLPLGTRIRVTNLRNNRKVIVTVTEHKPPGAGRIILISQEAAKNIGINTRGNTPVSIEILRGRRKLPPPAPGP